VDVDLAEDVEIDANADVEDVSDSKLLLTTISSTVSSTVTECEEEGGKKS
jgi:hypothetical protein